MRILELRLKNLNSLYGEWHIDFRDPQFGRSGIFAITGPTGSGKSTLLDAICLALYGRTPRLKQISKSGNEIFSRHRGECYAEVLFQTAKGQFRCHWSQHRARRKPQGNLVDPRHELSCADTGKILEDKRSAMAKAVEDLTGMNFDRFTRSMMLAQGGFAAFLQADPSSRAPLLEQLTGTEIYSRISKAAHEQVKKEEEQLNLIRVSLAEDLPMNPQDEEKIKQRLEEVISIAKRQEKELLDCQRSIEWWNRWSAIELQRKDWTEQQQLHNEELTQFLPLKQVLQEAKRASELDGPYQEFTALQGELQNLAPRRKSLEDEFPRLNQSLEESQRIYEEKHKELRNLKDSEKEQSVLFQEVILLDNQIKQTEDLLIQLATKQRGFHREEIYCKGNMESLEKERKENLNQASQLEDFWKSCLSQEYWNHHYPHWYSLTKDLETLEKMIQEFTRDLSIKKANPLAQRISSLEAAALEKKEQRLSLEENLAALVVDLSNLMGNYSMEQLERERELLIQQNQLHQRVLSLEEERARLMEGKPCPLCGSLEHPFQCNDLPESPQSELEQLGKTLEKCRSLMKEKQCMERDILFAAKNIERSDLEIENLKEQLIKDNDLIKQQQEKLDKYQKQREELQEELLHKVPGIEPNSERSYSEWLEWKNQQVKEMEQLGNKLDKRAGEINQDLAVIQEKRNSIALQLSSLEKEYQELRGSLESLSAKRFEIFQDRDPRMEENRLKEKLSKEEESLSKAGELVERQKEAYLICETRLQEIQNSQERLLEQFNEKKESLQKECQIRQWEGLEDFQTARRTTDEIKELEKTQQGLERRTHQLEQQNHEITRQMSAMKSEKEPDESLEDLQQKELLMKREINQSLQNQGSMEEQLKQNLTRKEKNQEKQKALDRQIKVYQQWMRLHELIGSYDGNKYRSYVQSLGFQQLIHQANLHLKRLSPRYLLRAHGEEVLEFQILDLYQGGEIRSTKNLSGGESFLVSLALALGLSEISRGNLPVESLFLDEGFGTLDEESLDMALSVLANLQNQGKTIGIISHIENLKERIALQIQVIPQAGGKSRIQGPGCSRV